MEIKSLFDLNCLISYEMAHYERVQKRKTCLKNAHFPSSHKVWNGIKEETAFIQNNLQYYKEIIDQATTFEGRDFATFLDNLLTSKEDFFQSYCIKVRKPRENDKKISKTFLSWIPFYFQMLFGKTSFFGTFFSIYYLSYCASDTLEESNYEEETYYFFGSQEMYNHLLKHKGHLSSCSNLEKLLQEIHISEGFLIKEGPMHVSLDGQLNRMNSLFPRFKSIMESLIDCYLKYPKKSSKERLDMVLREYKNLFFHILLEINKFHKS